MQILTYRPHNCKRYFARLQFAFDAIARAARLISDNKNIPFVNVYGDNETQYLRALR